MSQFLSSEANRYFSCFHAKTLKIDRNLNNFLTAPLTSSCLSRRRLSILSYTCREPCVTLGPCQHTPHSISKTSLVSEKRSCSFLSGCCYWLTEGLLTRSCKSTRRHSIEIMNSLMYLRDACYRLMDIDMHHGLREISSSWLHMTSSNSGSSKDNVTTLHQLRITDPFLNSIFRGDIVCYATAFIGQVRFTTTKYAWHKVTDDSSMILKLVQTRVFLEFVGSSESMMRSQSST